MQSLARAEDDIMSPDMLDSLFEGDLTELKKEAACSALFVEPKKLMAKKLETVGLGISG